MFKIRIYRNYFPKGNPWTESTSGEPGQARVAHRGPTAARTEGVGAWRRAHRSTAFGCSGAPKLTGGGAKEREEHGDLFSGLTGARAAAWQPGDAATRRGHRKLGGEGFRRGGGEERGSVSVGCSGGRRGGFYRAGGGHRGGGGGRSNGGDE
jgi:hypothetical protein